MYAWAPPAVPLDVLSGDRRLTAQLGTSSRRAISPPSIRASSFVEALAHVRLLHYSVCSRNVDDPAVSRGFLFHTHRYWQDRILALREQVALMDEPSLGSS